MDVWLVGDLWESDLIAMIFSQSWLMEIIQDLIYHSSEMVFIGTQFEFPIKNLYKSLIQIRNKINISISNPT